MRAKLFKPHQCFSNPVSIIISILLSSLIIPGHNAKSNSTMYKECKEKTTSVCGNSVIEGIEFPFWGGDFRPLDCGLGGFELSCDERGLAVDIGLPYKFHVVEIHPSEKALQLNHINPLDFFCGSTSTRIPDKQLNEKLYRYSSRTEDFLLFYHCTDDNKNNSVFNCGNEDEDNVYFVPIKTLPQVPIHEFSSCYNTTLPVDKMGLQEFLSDPKKLQAQDLFQRGFEVLYNLPNEEVCTNCIKAYGLCWIGTLPGGNDPCLYPDSGPPPSLPSGKRDNSRLIIGIATSLGGGFILILLAVSFFFYRRKKAKHSSYAVSRNVSSYSFSVSDSEKGSGTHMGVRTFSYNELEKATNNFDSNNELGDGGFGTVYKGKLQDGREVAVKRLYENSIKRVEQFMNEIVILTQLRHPNLVVLYGSTSQQCRNLLLVYEYIPNGTIADHLYGEDPERGNLTWKTRMSIAIETASALSYLHLSDVIHRDVKTTNILLDNNCHVKVADFGLSRLFPLHVTHVSTAPQGTPGYVDPEYHQCYQLTSKSDVYSFGVVLIELISSKPAVDITRHRHEINLATMAINKIQGDALHELVDPSLGFESDYEVRKMITEVAELAFRCLQHERESRPSMDEVYKTLKDIQSRNNGEKNESEYNLSKDDASLLKNYPQSLSPDSVAVKWISTTNSSSSS